MRKLLALTAAIAVAACATSSATPSDTAAGPPVTQPPVGTVSASTPVGATATWRASLQPMNGTNVTGSAAVTPNQGGAMATVNIMGATSGDVHPWHVHTGTCASGGGVFGPASAYTPLTVTAGGSASSTASLPSTLDPAQSYHVNVHKSPTDMGTIISCGNLTISKS